MPLIKLIIGWVMATSTKDTSSSKDLLNIFIGYFRRSASMEYLRSLKGMKQVVKLWMIKVWMIYVKLTRVNSEIRSILIPICSLPTLYR